MLYVDWIEKREFWHQQSLSSHAPIPPPPPIRSARYITLEPQSSKQSRFLIIEKLHEHRCGLPCCYFYHFKGRLPTTIAKMHCHLWNSKQLSFSIQVKALVQYRSPFQRQFIKQNKIVTSRLASGNASLFMKKIKVTTILVPIIRGQIIEVQLNYFMNSFAV